MIDAGAVELLRGHVERRADDRAVLGDAGLVQDAGEPDHREAARSSATNRIDVVLRIDQKSRRLVRDIPRADRLGHCGVRPEEQTTALAWRLSRGVRGDCIEHGARNAKCQRASTAMAIPMPPPMQSDATP